MFASFLVGVMAVGSLMFVSDRENWFTSDQALSQASNTASSAIVKAGDNGRVSAAADVVRPNNIAQLFEKSSPAVVKIETFTKQQTASRQLDPNDFFSQFFGDRSGSQDKARSRKQPRQPRQRRIDAGRHRYRILLRFQRLYPHESARRG